MIFGTRNSAINTVTRREFSRRISLAGAILTLPYAHAEPPDTMESRVALVKSPDRRLGAATAIQSLGGIDCQGKDIYLKCNFNSPDPFPASTHPEMLVSLVEYLRGKSSGRLTLVERSGMGDTKEIWRRQGIVDLAAKLDVGLLALEDLPKTDWKVMELPGSHWKSGVEAPGFLKGNALLIQLCNLKTHRFGGQFSASLKNSIGLIAKYSAIRDGHNYMAELHSSPDQRLMIAEVNLLYQPALVVMDALEIFISGGPERGEVASPNAILASKDRVALDAVGVAILRAYGATPILGSDPVFEYEQIKRAVELKIGVSSGDKIMLLTNDNDSASLALQVRAMLSITSEDKKP